MRCALSQSIGAIPISSLAQPVRLPVFLRKISLLVSAVNNANDRY